MSADASLASSVTPAGGGGAASAIGLTGVSPVISPGAYVPFEMAAVRSQPREPASAPTPLRMG
eukprot:5648905-Prymnesium_polylepis.1